MVVKEMICGIIEILFLWLDLLMSLCARICM